MPAPATHPLDSQSTSVDLALPDATWVVCLCAQWCGVCRDYQATFEQVSALHPHLRFAWLDIEDQADWVGDLDIETFPTVLVASSVGAQFLGTVTPHASTLSRLLEALGASNSVPTPLNVPVLVDALSRNPEFWVRHAPAG